jgi:hypothetical protein
MYFRPISGDGIHFGLPYGTDYTLAFSRVLYPQEALLPFNVSSQPRSDYVIVDADLHRAHDRMKVLFGSLGGAADVEVQLAPDGALCVRLNLAPREFAILR